MAEKRNPTPEDVASLAGKGKTQEEWWKAVREAFPEGGIATQAKAMHDAENKDPKLVTRGVVIDKATGKTKEVYSKLIDPDKKTS